MGFAGLGPVPKGMPFSPAVELAWRIDYEYWGQGYATEIANILLDYAAKDLKLKQVYAYCLDGNDRAAHVLDKLGFKHDVKGDFAYKHGSGQGEAKEYWLFAKDLI